MKVPFLDLKAQYQTIRDDIQSALNRVLDSQGFILGPEVDQFEKQIASYLGVPHAVGVASGSDALYLALVALGVGPGDGVITTPFTFFATGGAIVRTGARPLFADIDPRNYNLDPGKIAELIEANRRNPRANLKAIMPVHIFGQPAEMEAIQKIARANGLKIVEDACQAIGANFRGKRVGALSEFGCFSFFPSKNLGGFGDGGLAVTADPELARRIRRLRVHGSDRKYHHLEMGINSRLDALQAAALSVKLPHLDRWNEARRKKASLYDRALRDLPEVVLPPAPGEGMEPVYHLYVIRARKRDDLEKFLVARGIGAGVYYPLPLHLQPCFAGLGYREGEMPESERASREVLALPLYPELTDDQQAYVVQAVREFYQKPASV